MNYSGDGHTHTQSAFVLQLLTGLIYLGSLAQPTHGTTYYCDPEVGTGQGDGSEGNPWSTLEWAVSNKWHNPITDGDTVICLDGYHGRLGSNLDSKRNNDYITCQAQNKWGARLGGIENGGLAIDASYWKFVGFDICPEYAGVRTAPVKFIENHNDGLPCSNIWIDQCRIAAATDATAATWGHDDYRDNVYLKFANGVQMSLDNGNQIVTNCYIKNVKIGVGMGAAGGLISGNTFERFCDCLWSIGSNVTIEDNRAYDSIHIKNVDSHQDTIFADNVTYSNTNVIVRRNIIIGCTDTNRTWGRNGLFGLFFNKTTGVPTDCVVENNVLVVDTWCGIYFSNGNRVRISHNTVIPSPLAAPQSPPVISIAKQAEGARKSCTIYSNIGTIISASDDGLVSSNNIDIRGWGSMSQYFLDFAKNDFRPTSDSPAIGHGNTPNAPMEDLVKNMRGTAPCVGAYEYQAGILKLRGIGNRTATVGTKLTFEVEAMEPNDSLVYTANGAPEGAEFAGRTFSWTPAAGQIGSYHVTFTVSNGQMQDSETIAITVEAPQVPNSPPVLSDIGGKSVNENVLLSFAVGATDADSGDTLTYSAAGMPNGATFSGQTFSWTPGYDQAGSYQVTFTVSDSHAQDSRAVTITVVNVNRAPLMNSVSDRSVDAGNTLEFSIAATDPDGDTLTYSAGSMPAGATFSGQNFTWTPSSGQTGSFDITFTASDGSLLGSRTATITVVAPPPDTTAPVVARCSPEPDSIQVPLNNLVTMHVTDAGMGVDPGSVVIRVNDQIVYQGTEATHTSPYGRCSRSGSKNDYRYIYQPDQMAEYDQTVVVKVNAADLQGNVMSEYSYSYVTEMQSFGANKQLSKGTGAAGAGKPVTARDTTGNVWAAWHAGPEGSRDIYVAKLVSGADAFSSPVRLTSDAQDQCNPDLAAGPDGKVYVTWQDNRRGNWDVFAAVCSDHQNFSKETRVSDSNDNEINPAIAVDGQSPNRVYAAWQDGRNGNQDIYVASSANAFASTTISRVTTSAANQTEPDLAVGGQNIVYVVWTDMRNGQADIYAAASTVGPWTNVPVVTTSSAQTDPAVAAEPGGAVLHLLWVDNARGDRDIYYASLAGLPGSPVTGHSIVDDTSGADQLSPTIAYAQGGRAFACWQDSRHAGAGGADTDLYFAELRSGVAKTNILVGDDDTNTGQSEPAIGVNAHGHPYVVWSDDRDQPMQVYYAAGTFIDPDPLDSKLVAAAAGATIGTEPAAIDQAEDVSIVVPPGACQTDMRVTISRVINPQVQALDCLGSYDFGPSGIDFDQPVTVTIPYRYSSSDKRHALPYWYDSLTGALSQQGITDVENVVVSSDLNALRFKTTHFTAFYLVASDSDSGDATARASSGGGGGGCSISTTGNGSAKELLVPYAAIATIMIILRRRDRRRQKLLESIKIKE